MKFLFSKYHGAGNDFILIDHRTNPFNLTPDLAKRLCARRTGIGADGLILLEGSSEVDFTMRYFNSDGGEATLCGNGARCILAFASDLGLGNSFRFRAVDGIHEGKVFTVEERAAWFESFGKGPADFAYDHSNRMVQVSMPDVAPVESMLGGQFLNTGSPHFVRFESPLDEAQFLRDSLYYRHHEDFGADGTNVNFLSAVPRGIRVRTFERGVEGETLSCGTGVTAAALAWAMEEKRTGKQFISVQTKGGCLWVAFEVDPSSSVPFTNIELIGPVTKVYEAQSDLALFMPY